MSYDLQVLRDNPIGYWSFNNTNKDTTKYANTATISGTYVAPPIISNNGYTLRVDSSTTATITNTLGKYECFSNNYQNNTFTIAFWFSLNNQLNGSGAGTYTNDQLTLLSIKNSSTVIGKIVYDYKSNTIRYTFPGTTNKDSYAVVEDFDKQYYVVATYSNGSHSIKINGKSGFVGLVSDFSNMTSATKNNISFVVSDSSTTSTFLINSLAFYDYQLSDEQIKRHILWAGNDEKPNFQGSISASTSIFSFLEDNQDLGYAKTISGKDFLILGEIDKLSVTDNGLTPLNIDSPLFNNNYDTTAAYTINSSSGINWSGSAGIDVSFLPNYFNMTTGFTIYMTVNRTSTGSYNEYLFSLSNVNGKSMFLEYDVPDGNTNYHLKVYDPYTGSTTSIIDLSSGQSYSTAKISNVAVQFSGSLINLYTSDNSGVTASTSSGLPFNMNQNSILTIGNNYNSLKTLNSYINNFGITNQYFSSVTSIPFASLSNFIIPLTASTSPFLVKQRGTWTHQIPSVVIPFYNFYGTVFDWKTMDNCQVSYSINSGSTYNVINRHQTASLYNTLGVAQNISLKVQIDTDYVLDQKSQYFNNFYYNIYNPIKLVSDNEMYTLSPSTSSVSPNLRISNGTNNILARQKNFGIKFGGALPTNALITVPDSSSYSAIELWYRPDFIPTGSLRSNIIRNPSFESSNTSYWGVANSYRNSTGSSLFGASAHLSIQAAPNTPATLSTYSNSGATTYIAALPNTYYTFSAHIKNVNSPGGSITTRIREYDGTSSALITTTSSVFVTSASSWTRVYITILTGSSTGYIVPAIQNTSGVSTASTQVYITDGVMLEQSSSLNEYFDGSFTGASWSGTANVSSSSIVYASTVHIINNTISQSVNSSSIATAPAIYIDNFGKFRSLGGTLYINGASVVDGTYSASQNELYHLTLVLSSPTSSSLYLNGGNLVMNSTRSKGTYGYLQFWNSTPTAADIVDRYSQFIGKTTVAITDTNTSKLYSTLSPESYIITSLG